MSLKVNPKKAMYVICMLFILNMNYSLFHTSYVYQIGSLLSILSIIWIMAKGKIDRMLMDGIVGFVMPMICITLISVTTAIVIYHTGNSSDITQSVWRCILYVKGFILAYVSVKLFGKDCVRLITYAGLISYFTVIIRWIFTAGVPEMFHIFNNKINGMSLEIHNVTYCFGLLFIYYFLTDQGHLHDGVFLSKEDFPIVIRCFKNGDTIKTSGGTKKVSRLFIDRKIPRDERKIWPIVENCHGEIILIPHIAKNIKYLYTKPNVFVIKYDTCK